MITSCTCALTKVYSKILITQNAVWYLTFEKVNGGNAREGGFSRL